MLSLLARNINALVLSLLCFYNVTLYIVLLS